MGVVPDSIDIKATNISAHAFGDLAMAQGTGQRAAEQMISPEDELSLDDLDRIVGGLNSENGEGPVHEGGDGGYVPPTVHAPDHLPPQIAQVEANVSNHNITGDA